MVAAAAEGIRSERRQDLTPARSVEQGCILRQGLRPVAWQCGQEFPVAAQEACQPDHARVAEAAQQHVGNCGRNLTVGGGEDFPAVYECRSRPLISLKARK